MDFDRFLREWLFGKSVNICLTRDQPNLHFSGGRLADLTTCQSI